MPFLPLPTILSTPNAKPVVSSQWRTVGRWLWEPPDDRKWAVVGEFSATTDPGTTGQVRFRVVESAAATAPVTVSGPLRNARQDWLDLTFSDTTRNGGTSVVLLEARRTAGSGGVRILDAGMIADQVDVSGLPFIIDHITNQTVEAGTDATFRVNAGASVTGSLSYLWELSTNDGSTWSTVTGATTASLTVTGTTTQMSGRQYKVTVSNANGSVVSGPATLYVNAPGEVQTAPTITTQPSDQSAAAGNTATFQVAASGSTPLSYQWDRSTDAGATWSAVSGATSSSYTTPSLVDADNGNRYRVKVSNSVGSVTSNVVTLTVTAATAEKPGPVNDVTLEPAGSGELKFSWTKPTTGGPFTQYEYEVVPTSSTVNPGPIDDPLTGTTISQTNFPVVSGDVSPTADGLVVGTTSMGSGYLGSHVATPNVSMVDKETRVRFDVVPGGGTRTMELSWYTNKDARNGVSIVRTATTIAPRVRYVDDQGNVQDSFGTQSGGNWTAATGVHAIGRIRVQSGNVVFETSADGSAWTALPAPAVQPPFALNFGRVYLASGYTASSETSATVRFKGFYFGNVQTGGGGVTTPGAPTGVTASAPSAGTLGLSWTAPSSDGGAPISDHMVSWRANAATLFSEAFSGTGTWPSPKFATFYAAPSNAGSTSHNSGWGRLTSGSTAYVPHAVILEDTVTADSDQRYIIRWPALFEQYTYIQFRGDGAARTDPVSDQANGYRLEFRPHAGQINFARIDNSTLTSLATSPQTWSPTANGELKVRIQASGSDVKVRYWTGATEPTTWQWEVTDSNHTARRRVTLSHWNGADQSGGAQSVEFDSITISGSGAGSWSTPVSTGSTATTATIGGITAGTSAVGRVAAVNSQGQGPWSNDSNAVTIT